MRSPLTAAIVLTMSVLLTGWVSAVRRVIAPVDVPMPSDGSVIPARTTRIHRPQSPHPRVHPPARWYANISSASNGSPANPYVSGSFPASTFFVPKASYPRVSIVVPVSSVSALTLPSPS